MENYYKDLIDMANKIITKQMNNKDNEGVIILFISYEKANINGQYRLLNISHIDDVNAGSGKIFIISKKQKNKLIIKINL